jgi:oligopeptide transport system substrate-binding protein
VDDVAFISLNFSGLMTFDPKTLEPIPANAESYTVSPDGKTYTFKLRKKLQYSDGTPLTARNFEYAWKRLVDPDLASEYASIAYDIVGAQEYNTADIRQVGEEGLQKLREAVGVKATDEETLVFTLKNPAVYFPSIAALWVGYPTRQDIVEKEGDKWATQVESYIGNGPFILKDWEPQTKAVWEANPNYYLGRPKLDRLEAVVIQEQDAAMAYKNEEIDWVRVSAADLESIQKDKVLSSELHRYPSSCTWYVGFNTKRPPLENVKVRQAFAQALDREGYIKDILQGVGKPAYSFIPPGIPGYEPGLVLWKFDPVAAKQTLAEAGYPDGKGLPEIRFTFSGQVTPGIQWLQAQWHDNLGVEVKLDAVESRAYHSMLQRQETTPQLFTLGWCADYPDPQNWLTMVFHSGSTIQRTGWKSAEFDRLVKQADGEQDKSKRLSLYSQAQHILVTEAPVVFWAFDEDLLLIKPYVKGITLTSLDYLPGIFKIHEVYIER